LTIDNDGGRLEFEHVSRLNKKYLFIRRRNIKKDDAFLMFYSSMTI